MPALAYVTGWGPLSGRCDERTERGTLRLVQTIEIPVTIRLAVAEITAGTHGDYITAITQRLVDLHLADAAWLDAVKVKNRLNRVTVAAAALSLVKILGLGKAPADFAEWDLRWLRFGASPTADSPFGPMTTFGNMGATAPPTCPGTRNQIHVFELRIIHASLLANNAAALLLHTERILTAAGNRLAL